MGKIPQISILFWVLKICATTLGETAGDLLSMTLDVGYGLSSLILITGFLISLWAQLRAKNFHPALYWLVILTTSTAGTTLSDYMDRSLGLGYAKGSLVLILCLAATLVIWKKSEGSLDIERIKTVKGEIFYWSTILFSNTLGTAFGDFLADDSSLGFFGGAALIAGVLVVLYVLNRVTTISRVFLFWSAFVLTRPLGATVGDFLTKPADKGGINLGTIGSTAVLLSVLVVLILYSVNKKNRQAARV